MRGQKNRFGLAKLHSLIKYIRMRLILLTMISLSILLPAAAFSNTSAEGYCKKDHRYPSPIFDYDLSYSEKQRKYEGYFICVAKRVDVYLKKKRAMILNEGGFTTGNLKVCKKIKHFKLRQPTKSQCWYLPAGTNVNIEGTGSKVPIKLSWWSTVYGDATICKEERPLYSCIQSHKKID